MKKIFIFSIMFLIACKESSHKKNKLSQQEINQAERKYKDSIRFNNESTIANKYHAELRWDTLDLYTYELQQKFASNLIVASHIRISDIIKSKNLYVIKGNVTGKKTNSYYVELNLSLAQDSIIKRKYSKEVFFVFKINEIGSLIPHISSESELDTDMDDNDNILDCSCNSYPVISNDLSERYIKGDIIDFLPHEKDNK